MRFDTKGRSEEELLEIYRQLLLPRLIEERMFVQIRQGKVSKWFSAFGQEAISVGVTLGMNRDEYLLPAHRNLGVFTARQIPLDRLFAQFQGKPQGFTKGRDRSFHFGTHEYGIIGMISHMAAQLPLATGIALAHQLSHEEKAVVTFCGDGASSEGDFHEAMNLAAVWDLPVIFVIENNGYAISTPNAEQFRFESFVSKGAAYGMEAVSVDGNNVLEVMNTIEEIAKDIRQQPRPILVEAKTFRMRGHEEASGTDYVPGELLEQWSKMDPVQNFEQFLITQNIAQSQLDLIKESLKDEINQALEQANAYDFDSVDLDSEINDVYAQSKEELVQLKETDEPVRFLDAINKTLQENMERNDKVILLGQDIAEHGGVFKVTKGLVEIFGKERVRNTPISESVTVGCALGLAMMGYKPVVEMQFADFVSCAFNQIVNNLAKSHYRWGQQAGVIIRMPAGVTASAGPFHSQSNEAWFAHVPGLKILYPSNPGDAAALLNAAFRESNPVLFFEQKSLYRSSVGNISNQEVAIGKAKTVKEGNDLTIVTYGLGVKWSVETTEELSVDAQVIDLRSLIPWDQELVKIAVQQTGKVIVLTEDNLTGGFGAEIAAWISEHCFEYLDAPVSRVASLDTPIPFGKMLETQYLPKERLKERILQLLQY